nr:AMIN domain-containing protein [Clostridia bacterium]
MMARLIKIMLTMLTIMLFTSVVSFAGSEDIVIQLDGTEIVNDSPPVIVEKRTLVPARAVFEAMGGEVSWDDVQRTVTVELEDTTVVLVIDSKIAYINGQEQEMDVPAMILSNTDNKNGRTMIPVRFVAEAIGCDVDWNEADRIVSIVTPEGGAITDFIKISQIELSADGSKATIYADNEIIDFDSFEMDSPNRLVIDIDNAILDMDEGTIWPDSNDYIRSIRSSQYSEDTVRIVADLKK